ncbi:hypothetical protein DID88_003516 [Monilinia fructigena]|uniref:Uncharacterized protein n=1 Tax=Monilinia fructigena TaxID=38457 RepID=A0A395IWT0_9HELO|nr:hypothetical protein DID88_003516 [Monilinia fructigena]
MSSGKVKTGQLWSKNKADLAKQLGDSPRSTTSESQLPRSSQSLTPTNAHNFVSSTRERKYLPLDLRPKQTRAIRRRLTKHEQELQLEKDQEEISALPTKKVRYQGRGLNFLEVGVYDCEDGWHGAFLPGLFITYEPPLFHYVFGSKKQSCQLADSTHDPTS